MSSVLRKRPDRLLLQETPNWPAQGYFGSAAVQASLERDRGEALVRFGHSHWPAPLSAAGSHQLLNCGGRVVILPAAR